MRACCVPGPALRTAIWWRRSADVVAVLVVWLGRRTSDTEIQVHICDLKVWQCCGGLSSWDTGCGKQMVFLKRRRWGSVMDLVIAITTISPPHLCHHHRDLLSTFHVPGTLPSIVYGLSHLVVTTYEEVDVLVLILLDGL